MLDVDGDGLITLNEMLECIKEAYAARELANRHNGLLQFRGAECVQGALVVAKCGPV